MLLLSRLILLFIILLPAKQAFAGNGFFGFTQGTPLSQEEKNPKQLSAPRHIVNYRQKMRDTLNMLTQYAKKQKPNFKITAHEGRELLDIGRYEASLEGYNAVRNHTGTDEDTTFLQYEYSNKDTPASLKYASSLNAVLLNNLFCGNNKQAKLPEALKRHQIKTVAVDFCTQEDELDEAIQVSVGLGIPLYAFHDKDKAFNNIEEQMIINENAKNIFEISQAQNIILLTNDQKFSSKENLIAQLRDTNFDIVVIPALFHEKYPYTPDEIRNLKFKKNGTIRIILAELNVSEISPMQYYWQDSWKKMPPEWIKRNSLVSTDAKIVQYWHPSWLKILSLYMKGIIDSDFDGVVYTGLDNYRYFDTQTPLD